MNKIPIVHGDFLYRFFVSSDTILQLCYIVLTKITTLKINIQKGAWIMKFILMRTVSGKTYYARTEKNNAIKKTEDIALAQRFASEKDAKKMRDRASRKLNGYKIHPVSDESQKALPDSKIQVADATPSVSNPPTGISSSSHRKCFSAQERAAVYNKTEGHCAICGEFVPYTDFTVDHIIPLAKGGNNDLSNLQCACNVCNRIKQDILPEDLMKKLTRIMVYQVGQKGNKKYKKILRKACR